MRQIARDVLWEKSPLQENLLMSGAIALPWACEYPGAFSMQDQRVLNRTGSPFCRHATRCRRVAKMGRIDNFLQAPLCHNAASRVAMRRIRRGSRGVFARIRNFGGGLKKEIFRLGFRHAAHTRRRRLNLTVYSSDV